MFPILIFLLLLMGSETGALCLRALLSKSRSFLARNLEVRVVHTYREGNYCAGWLTRRVVTLSLSFHVLHSVLNGLSPLLLSDISRASIPALIQGEDGEIQ